jgi:uncharacterized membrane protein
MARTKETPMTTLHHPSATRRRTLAALIALVAAAALVLAAALALAATDSGAARAGGSPGGVLRAGGAPGGVLRAASPSSYAHGIFGGRLQTHFRMHTATGDELAASAAP